MTGAGPYVEQNQSTGKDQSRITAAHIISDPRLGQVLCPLVSSSSPAGRPLREAGGPAASQTRAPPCPAPRGRLAGAPGRLGSETSQGPGHRGSSTPGPRRGRSASRACVTAVPQSTPARAPRPGLVPAGAVGTPHQTDSTILSSSPDTHATQGGGRGATGASAVVIVRTPPPLGLHGKRVSGLRLRPSLAPLWSR